MLYKEHFVSTVGAIRYLMQKGTNMYQYKDIEVVKGKIKHASSTTDFAMKTMTSLTSLNVGGSLDS